MQFTAFLLIRREEFGFVTGFLEKIYSKKFSDNISH